MAKLPSNQEPLGKVQRLGVPKHGLSDLYVFLIDGTWWRVMLSLCGGWLLSNLIFAGLYLLGGDCIAGARPGSYIDAFNFSVQTLSTMGFGGMIPTTPWANSVVAVEALVGMLETAVATGLIFAKFSRPRASALFGEVAVITQWQGKKVLMFRVANRRGNDVVEAAMRVSVLIPEVSADGHHMRRLHELALVRDRSPMFTLSWTAIHIIDENSPFYGIDAAAFTQQHMLIIISLTGFDGTYMQTVHARHVYRGTALRWGRRLVDVMEFDKDGAVVLDFSHFHDTEPEPT